jgi:hypothetical protein
MSLSIRVAGLLKFLPISSAYLLSILTAGVSPAAAHDASLTEVASHPA